MIFRLLEAGVNGPYDRPRDPRCRRHTLLHLASASGNLEVQFLFWFLFRWSVSWGSSSSWRLEVLVGGGDDVVVSMMVLLVSLMVFVMVVLMFLFSNVLISLKPLPR